MELDLIRNIKTPNSTIGDLSINGKWECYILEDTDRGLQQEMTLDEIVSKKIKGQTAIPTGRYEIVISYSNKFQKKLPLLMNVPGFEGIRIHSGNTNADTIGCLMPGNNKETDKVTESRDAFALFFKKIEAAMKNEKIFITIRSGNEPLNIIKPVLKKVMKSKKIILPKVFKKGSV